MSLNDAGVDNVVATCGPLSEEQTTYLQKRIKSGQLETIYSCFDNDPAGRKYQKKLEDALGQYCVPDKEYEIVEKLRWIAKQKRLQGDDSESIGAEIPPLKKIVCKVIGLDKKYNDIDEYLKCVDDPSEAFKKLQIEATRHLKPLKNSIRDIKAAYKSMGINTCSNEIGELFFDYFNTLGSFFITGEEVKLFHNCKIYEIGNNIAFKALTYKASGLNPADNITKSVLEVVKAEAYERGKHTSAIGWIYTNLKDRIFYIALNVASNKIIKIQSNSVELLPNGANEEHILLESTSRIKPFNYLPNADRKEGMRKVKELIFDNLACNESNRYYVLSLLIFVFFSELVNARGITKFSGNEGTAKSFAARLCSYLMFGDDCLLQASVASLRAEASKNPLMILDNLEQSSITKELTNFMLGSATNVSYQKRDSNTNSGNIVEINKSNIVVTSIEPFTLSELISRTLDISFDKQYRNKNFQGETSVKTQILQYRNLIVSAIFDIIAFDILPTFEQDQAQIYKFLNLERLGHSKERLNELLACRYLCCKAIVKYIPHSAYKGENAAQLILDDWICEQDSLATSNKQDTDPILHRLEILIAECCQLTKETFIETYGIRLVEVTRGIDGEPFKISIIPSSRELCVAFSMLSKNKGIPNEFSDPGVLGKRLSNSKTVLERAGWVVEIRYKKVRGEHKHLLTKKVGDII